MLKSLSRAPIHDAGARNPPRRKHVDDDGVVVWEKLPPQPYARYVNAAGHIVTVPLTNSAAIRNANNPYAHRVHERARRAGMIRYGKCPAQTLEGLPRSMAGKRPCAPGSYSEDECCSCVTKIIENRRSAHEQRERESAERHKSMEQRRMELAEAREERVAAAEARAATVVPDGAES